MDHVQQLSLVRPKTVPSLRSSDFAKSEAVLKNETLWRESVKNSINLNNEAINASDKHIYISKNVDPLCNLREVLRTLSNNEAFKYMRQCRLSVGKLRNCWVEVNEEIKSLMKNKEYLESAIEHVRKDLIINNETIENRVKRPASEPPNDNVDEMLQAEKNILLLIKKNLEAVHKPVQEYLFTLDSIRETVFKLCQERTTVTDLICQCLTQSIRTFDRVATTKPNSLKKAPSDKLSMSQTDFAVSDPNAKFLANNSTKRSVPIGPLSCFTPEIVEIMKEAARRIAESKELRNRSKNAMKDSFETIKSNNKTIDEAFLRKIEETMMMSKSLGISGSENQLAVNRATRWNDLNTISYKYTLGPEKNTNLTTYEKLERPIIKTFQKHPGNQVPEAQEMHKGSTALKESVENSQAHIKTLKIIGQRLDSSMKQKDAQLALDSNLLRKRKELAGHRWVPVNYIK